MFWGKRGDCRAQPPFSIIDFREESKYNTYKGNATPARSAAKVKQSEGGEKWILQESKAETEVHGALKFACYDAFQAAGKELNTGTGTFT